MSDDFKNRSQVVQRVEEGRGSKALCIEIKWKRFRTIRSYKCFICNHQSYRPVTICGQTTRDEFQIGSNGFVLEEFNVNIKGSIIVRSGQSNNK